ncbi:complex component RRP43 [Seminavis robusta]|uniref:Ribosomal RNA-processing protein 42 n=1 Tax=Seminavis robusta TaxID=568900 RepID=A0A9N8DY57_9STRA|nr:complex component RRP43 [Seminavis robusta]|eukprot:Sro445_g144430.1 complex component RRP43 (331) ;mRNA; r:916-1908
MASGLALQLSESEKLYLIDGCADNCRLDGREREDIRQYTIVTSSETTSADGHPPLMLSNGSARLILSSSGSTSTHILCSVKVEVMTPSQSQPNQGNLIVHVEDSLAANSSLSRKKNEEDRNRVQSIISELLATNLIDLESLCIIPYHYAFNVSVDVEILSGTAGSIIDACCHAIRAALQNTLLPKVVPSSIVNDAGTSMDPVGSSSSDLMLESDLSLAQTPSGIDNAAVVVTVTVCHRALTNSYLLLLDASLEEEACCFCQVHVAVDAREGTEPTICALRKTGNGSLPWELLPEITALAVKAVPMTKSSFRVAGSSRNNASLLQTQLDIQ